MTLNEYQALASRTINQKLSNEEMLMHALHEIASECGEIHSFFQKVYQGHEIDEAKLKLEIGDLIWGASEFCTAKGWSLEDVAYDNIKKLKDRYPDGFSVERSLHRNQESDHPMSDVEKAIYRTICKR